MNLISYNILANLFLIDEKHSNRLNGYIASFKIAEGKFISGRINLVEGNVNLSEIAFFSDELLRNFKVGDKIEFYESANIIGTIEIKKIIGWVEK